MKKGPAWAGILLISASACALGQFTPQPDEAAQRQAKYTQEILNSTLQFHNRRGFVQVPRRIPKTGLGGPIIRGEAGKEKTLVFTTWFLDGRIGTNEECSVSDSGKMYSARDVYNWAVQADSWVQINPRRLQNLRKTLQSMPPDAKNVPPANRLLVSFWDGKTWTTRIYDRLKAPPEAVDVFRSTGVELTYATAQNPALQHVHTLQDDARQRSEQQKKTRRRRMP